MAPVTNHDPHAGLAADVSALLGRRRMLGLLAGVGLATIVGCGSSTGNDGPPGGGMVRP